MTHTDLIVVGGGPAGLASAIHGARAGMRVVVFEPNGGDHEGIIDKACGEGIMPGGVAALRSLGIEPEGVPFVGVRYRHATDSSLVADGSFRHGDAGIGVRRTVLHKALLETALSMSDVRIVSGRVTSIEQQQQEAGGGENICVNNGEVRARWLIGADGLRSKVRDLLGVNLPSSVGRPPRLGVRRHYQIAPFSDRVEVYFADGAEAYVTPVSEDCVGVAILFTPGAAETSSSSSSFDALLQKFPLLTARLGDAPALSRARGAGPFEQRVSRRVVGRALLVGDAAGYLDPLTGEGISLGLATARAAIASLVRAQPEEYEAAYKSLTTRYFTLTSLLRSVVRHRALHRPLLHLARATPFVFDRILDTIAHLEPGRPRVEFIHFRLASDATTIKSS